MTSPATFTTHIHSLDYLMGMTYLEIPSGIVQQLGGSFSIRLVCTVNGSLSWQCGLVALGQGRLHQHQCQTHESPRGATGRRGTGIIGQG